MSNPFGYGVAMGRKGRAGLVLPFDSWVKLAGFGMTVILSIVCLILWGVAEFWHPLCWAVTMLAFGRWAYKKRKKT